MILAEIMVRKPLKLLGLKAKRPGMGVPGRLKSLEMIDQRIAVAVAITASLARLRLAV